MLFLALASVMGLAVFDGWLTLLRITEYGIGIELNPVIRWLVKYIGIHDGVILGIFLPTLALASLGYLWLHGLLWFILGVRFTLFTFQIKSLEYERSRPSSTNCRTF